MIRIAVCDDDPIELTRLLELVDAYQRLHCGIAMEVESFCCAGDLLEVLGTSRYDVYLVDILMPGMTGLELARLVKKRDRQSVLIFVTNSRDFALEAFSVDAIQYILKPATQETLNPALDKAVAMLDVRQASGIMVNTRDGVKILYSHNIVYAECNSHAVSFHLLDGTVVQSRTLRQGFGDYVSPILEDGSFMRPHQSFVVNKRYVRRLQAKVLEMKGGSLIPIAKERLSEIKKSYISYIESKTED